MPLLESRASGSALAYGFGASAGGLTLSNLVSYFDASKSASYPGSGSTWYDLSGNGNNASLNGGWAYQTAGSGGHIRLDGGSGYIQLSSNSSAAPYANQQYTIDMWTLRYEDSTNYEILWSQDYTTHGPPYYSTHIRYDNASAHSGTTSLGGTPFTGPTGITTGNSGWIHWVFTNTPGGSAVIYKNGQVHNTVAGASPTYYGNPLWIGKSNFMSSSRMQFGEVRYYNKALTSTEASNNFKATKTRYGL